MAARRALLDLLERAGQLLREGTTVVYANLRNLELELYATVRALEESEAEIEARSVSFPASLPPWLVMQWLPLREVAAALRVAWSWRLDSEYYFRVFAERHRLLVSVPVVGVLMKWELRVHLHVQMQRSGQLTEFQEQVFRYYRASGVRDDSFIPIGDAIAAVRLVVNDATAEQVKTAVANLVSSHRLRASATGEGHINRLLHWGFLVLQQCVLDYYEEHATSEEGLATNAVAAGLSIDPALVRMAVDKLCTEGSLCSTIDDDHYKYDEVGSLLYLYGAPDY